MKCFKLFTEVSHCGPCASGFVIYMKIQVEFDNVLSNFIAVPSGIASPKIISSTSREINISWTAPNDLGGLPLTGYQIEVTPDLGKTWLTQDFLSTSSDETLEGLTPYTNYQVRVAGVNILGIGTYSDWSDTIMTDTDGILSS